MPTGGTAPRVMTLEERMAARGETPPTFAPKPFSMQQQPARLVQPTEASGFALESGIPVPEKARKAPPYPFEDMQVGQSFFVAGGKAVSLAVAARHACKTSGYKFLSRNVEGGARCWRIA